MYFVTDCTIQGASKSLQLEKSLLMQRALNVKCTLVILSSTASFGTPSNILFTTLVLFALRWLVIKSHFLKSLRTKTFCLKQVLNRWC